MKARPDPVPPLLTAALLAPVVVRSSWQFVGVSALVVAGLSVGIVAITSGRRARDWALAVVLPTALGMIIGWPPLVAYGGLCVVAAAVALRGPSASWPLRPVPSLVVQAVGTVVGQVLFLVGSSVVVPAAVLAGSLAASLLVDVALVRRPPSALDLRARALVDRVVRWWSGTATVSGSATPPSQPGWAVLAISAVLAGALWAVGLRALAVVGLASSAAAVIVGWYLPAARPALDAALRRVVTTVVLLPVYVLVVVPLGVVRRLMGRPPLDLGWHRPGPTYWHEHRGSPPNPLERMYSDERAWRSGDADGSRGAATVARTVVAVLAIQLVVVGAVWAWRERTEPIESFSGATAPDASQSAALEGYDWADDASRELAEVTSGVTYTPNTGWSVRDHQGRYVNVRNRVRRSYQPAVAAGSQPLDVWFFGGSTMFGFDLQRDAHTIPSEVARLAEDEGISLRVRNYGTFGYVNYQETILLSLLLTAGERPDLVVFYDGSNDVSGQLLNLFANLGPVGEPTDLEVQVLRDALASSGALPGLTPEPAAPLGTAASQRPPTVAATAEAIASVYRQGFDLASALAERFDVPIVHTWQPDAYSKQPLDPGELSRLRELGADAAALRGMRRLTAAVRAQLPDGVRDLSASLDGVEGPVLSDSVHLNERGAATVAAALYRSIEPDLRSLLPAR